MTPLVGPTLITGGTGSLGQAILRRARAEGWDATFTVYSRDEVKQATLRDEHPEVRYLLGDVQDADTLGRAMSGIDTVIHAAAYKRVPEAESEALACLGANVTGSANVIREAVRAGVRRVIGISTDKACHPINVYGMTKALMERAMQAADAAWDTRFYLVRYGNVIASRGSVVPMFRAQAARGGPITVTDAGMTRFWLTLDDAVDLVLQVVGRPSGTVLVPRCPSADMATLAEAAAPGVPVVSIGTRSAEKRHESLISEDEAPYAEDLGAGWLLHRLAGSLHEVDASAYDSNAARRLSADELRAAIDGERTRLL